MRGSQLVDKIMPAYGGNYNNTRFGYTVKKITLHHMAAVWSIERLGELWQTVGRKGSSHYGIGNDGRIGQYVSEDHTAWTDSNELSNMTSVTIETSNSQVGGNWLVSDNALNSLIKLVADIAKRNNLGKLVRGQNFTWHKMYYNTACPGPYLMSKIDYIIEEANKINYPPYPFEIGTTIYPKEDIFLYSNAGYGNATMWRIEKGTECRVATYHDVKGLYMALKDTYGNYFRSAWTNEFDKFSLEKPIIEPTPIEKPPIEEPPIIEIPIIDIPVEQPIEPPIAEEIPIENFNFMKLLIETIIKILKMIFSKK